MFFLKGSLIDGIEKKAEQGVEDAKKGKNEINEATKKNKRARRVRRRIIY